MLVRSPLRTISILILLSGSSVAHAQATIDVIMDTGKTLGSGGGNPDNAGIFFTGSAANPQIPVNGVTTNIVDPTGFYSNGASPKTGTYHSIDSATGAEFTYDITLNGYQSQGGTISPTNLRNIGSNFGVDSTLAGETNNQIDSAAFLGGNDFEFLRVSVDNINVLDPGTLTEPLEFAGFFGANIRTAADPPPTADEGTIFEAGTGDVLGTNVVGTWDDAAYRVLVDWDGLDPLPQALDFLATGDQAAVAGLRLRFQEAQTAAVPEPASIAIWAMFGLVLGGCGFYRARRMKSCYRAF